MGPKVVKAEPPVRDGHRQNTPRLQHLFAAPQEPDRIGQMLKIVGRNARVECTQPPPFSDQVCDGRG